MTRDILCARRFIYHTASRFNTCTTAMFPLMVPVLLLFLQMAPGTSSNCPDVASCSSSENLDPCCVPSPAGLFLFRQRFEPDVEVEGGRWGIDGLEVLNCDETAATTTYTPSYNHEKIASFCLRSSLFGEEGFARAEGDWAQSEVGEGVEEVWERTWNSAGRFISTQAAHCSPDRTPEHGVAAFFMRLQQLHERYPLQKMLTDADITPSEDTTYSLDLIQDTLKGETNQGVLVTCDNTTLSSVSWPFHIRGTFQDGEFEPATTSRKSNCPSDGIIYPPSTSIVTPSATETWDPLRRPTPRPITLSHDESRMYYRPSSEEVAAARGDPRKLGIFKSGDERREGYKGDRADKAFVRDEL